MGNNKYDLDGNKFGNLLVIGDTGNRDRNGNKIYITRNIETGELKEASSIHLRRGQLTGYQGSKKQKKISGMSVRKTRLNLEEKQEKTRTINSKITSYINSKGYHYDKSREKWAAYITIGRRKKYLGRYETEQQAIEARQKAVNKQIKILEKQLEEL